MTWKSHCLTNGALAFAMTGRLDVTLAAVATAALPDQMERFLPLGRHRGATHWLLFWMLAVVLLPICVEQHFTLWPREFLRSHGGFRHQGEPAVAMAMFGLALGPLLHVLLDGCSSDGVPLGPFLRGRMRLGIYRTWSRTKWPWDISEMLFVVSLLIGCAAVWHVRWR
jgi:membrane-bound metal-dependent hydrolase YbcI (DUF457 family)